MSASNELQRRPLNIPPFNKQGRFAEHVYSVLLRGYPSPFRNEYGQPMMQLFRDCYRDRRLSGRRHVSLFWLRMLIDFIRTAPRQHLESLGKENSTMKNLGRDLVAVVGCLVIIAIAFFLLSYGRKHEASSILTFGYVLDAIVVTGALGNLTVFILVKATRFDPVKIALWTFLVVNSVPAVLLLIVGGKMDPQFRPAATLIGYAASFAFWFGIHWAWSQTKSRMQPAS
jgi:hypothetical protein